MIERALNLLIILIIAGVLLSAFGVQFIAHETPCPLCLLQRLSMIGVILSLLMNLVFGIKPSHYALGLFSCLTGGFVALRQISLHVCPQFPTFGLPVLGLSLYTWSFIVFICSVLGIAILLCFYDREKSEEVVPLQKRGVFTLALILLIILVNFLATLKQCGLGPCISE